METKDYLTIMISSGALIFSLISFIIVLHYRKYEEERTIRKSLTDTISELSSLNLKNVKLKLEYPELTEDVINIRRRYNEQRRYLINHAEFLINQIPNLATDIDYNIIATASNSVEDYDKANKFWEMCVAKSPNNTLKSMNLRGYARFLYFQGNSQLGRKKFEESLQLTLPDTDNIRRMKTDTYLMWAKTESDFSFSEEAKRLYEQAKVACGTIGNKNMRDEIMTQIKNNEKVILGNR